MTPEYIEMLAELADPGQLWKSSPLADLSPEHAQIRDVGIALRRYAAHVRRLHGLIGTGYSLLITPMSHNTVLTPESRVRRGALIDPLGPVMRYTGPAFFASLCVLVEIRAH